MASLQRASAVSLLAVDSREAPHGRMRESMRGETAALLSAGTSQTVSDNADDSLKLSDTRGWSCQIASIGLQFLSDRCLGKGLLLAGIMGDVRLAPLPCAPRKWHAR
jgi:hypothetical protein